jgi:hypothetical protein
MRGGCLTLRGLMLRGLVRRGAARFAQVLFSRPAVVQRVRSIQGKGVRGAQPGHRRHQPDHACIRKEEPSHPAKALSV